MISGMRRLSGNRQNRSLYIRLFEDELESIKTAAAREEKTVSEYVRARVLDNRPNVPAARVPDPPAETVQPIAVQSSAKERPAAREKKPWKEVKAPAPGKKKLCPHGFAIVSGITACARCN
jgi:hypothetical protein